MQSELTMMKPEGLLRFMVYTSSDRREAIQMGGDVWMDLATIYGDQYAYGSRFGFRAGGQGEAVNYVVAMLPIIKQINNPRKLGEKVPLRVVYLATEEQWPQFEPLTDQNKPNTIKTRAA